MTIVQPAAKNSGKKIATNKSPLNWGDWRLLEILPHGQSALKQGTFERGARMRQHVGEPWKPSTMWPVVASVDCDGDVPVGGSAFSTQSICFCFLPELPTWLCLLPLDSSSTSEIRMSHHDPVMYLSMLHTHLLQRKVEDILRVQRCRRRSAVDMFRKSKAGHPGCILPCCAPVDSEERPGCILIDMESTHYCLSVQRSIA